MNDRRDNVLAGKRKERKQWEATTKAKPLTDKKKRQQQRLAVTVCGRNQKRKQTMTANDSTTVCAVVACVRAATFQNRKGLSERGQPPNKQQNHEQLKTNSRAHHEHVQDSAQRKRCHLRSGEAGLVFVFVFPWLCFLLFFFFVLLTFVDFCRARVHAHAHVHCVQLTAGQISSLEQFKETWKHISNLILHCEQHGTQRQTKKRPNRTTKTRTNKQAQQASTTSTQTEQTNKQTNKQTNPNGTNAVEGTLCACVWGSNRCCIESHSHFSAPLLPCLHRGDQDHGHKHSQRRVRAHCCLAARGGAARRGHCTLSCNTSCKLLRVEQTGLQSKAPSPPPRHTGD